MRLALLLPVLVCVISIFTLVHTMSNAEGEQNDNEIEALGIGQVVFVNSLSVDEQTKQIGSQLHFCFFENGEKDWIYVAVPHGYWENGEVDLLVDGNVAATIKVPNLSDVGALIKHDNVVQDLRERNGMLRPQLSIDNIRGFFK